MSKPRVYSNFTHLKNLCKDENEDKEIREHTCALVKKFEKVFHQPTVWENKIGPQMIAFKTHINGENYIGGGEADFLWKNEKVLLDKWNMNIASHSIHYGQAGGGFSDYGGGPGIAWEWSTHRFFFKLPHNFFDGSLKHHDYPYSPTLKKDEDKDC